jgi:DNA polymerase elongation subunit (family B)
MPRLYLLHAAWEKEDVDQEWPDRKLQIIAKTPEGGTAHVTVEGWLPYVYARVPQVFLRDAGAYARNLAKEHRAESWTVVRRRQFVGFTNLKESLYVMLRFRRYPIGAWNAELKCRVVPDNFVEADIKAHHKFFHETGLRSGAWFELPDSTPKCAGTSRCGVHYTCLHTRLRPLPECNEPPKLTIMAYDLETGGLDPKRNQIYQCCLIFWNSDQPVPAIGEDPRSVVICTQPTDEVGGTRVVRAENESDLFVKVREHIIEHDPDILTGYNLLFDNNFLDTRGQRYPKEFAAFLNMGRMPHIPSSFQRSSICSAALGNNERILWNIPGRWVLDLMLYAKSNFTSLPNYKLDTMGSMFVGEQKHDMPFGRILAAFADPDAHADRGVVATYCDQDGRLCLLLMKSWSAHISNLEEAAVACVNASTVNDSGRQIKVVSMIQGEIFGKYVFNSPPPAPPDGYQGATVIEPSVGYYGGPTDQVVLLDFASLYPNIMRSYGVCPSRLVRTGYADEEAAALEEGVVVVEHQVGVNKVVRLAQPTNDGKPPFTIILEKLLDERKKVRKQMKTETDPAVLNVLDCRQKCKKVSCNSCYGLLGTTTGYLPLPDLAAVTTYQGRQALDFTIDVVVKDYGCTVVGGDTDSVFILLPHPTPVPAEPDDEWMRERMRYVFRKSSEIADEITRRLHANLGCDAMAMEHEGVMYPFAYYRKKHYASMLWENPEEPNKKIKIKGLVAIRNDWSLITKKLANEVLDMSIKQRRPEEAVAHLRSTLADMRAGRLDVGLFRICKELHTYTPKTKSAHTNMCIRIRNQDPHSAPILGTKVDYVIRRGPEDISDRAYPPEEVRPEDIDVEFYFEKQLLKPLSEILAPMINGGIGKLRRILINENASQAEITKYIAVRPRTDVAPPPTAAERKLKRKATEDACKRITEFTVAVGGSGGSENGGSPPAKPVAKPPAKKAAVASKKITSFFTAS